jgi:hypothetical protein
VSIERNTYVAGRSVARHGGNNAGNGKVSVV